MWPTCIMQQTIIAYVYSENDSSRNFGYTAESAAAVVRMRIEMIEPGREGKLDGCGGPPDGGK